MNTSSLEVVAIEVVVVWVLDLVHVMWVMVGILRIKRHQL